MWYVITLLFASLVLAARRRRRRSNRFFAYPVEKDLILGALASNIAFDGDLTAFGSTRVRCISADLQWSMNNHVSGEGPISVGLSSSDLSVTEIIEHLDARPTSQSDIVAMERSRRPVRRAGVFSAGAGNEHLNDGKAIRTKLRFSVNEGVELSAWARNEDTAALTTGTIIHVTGTLYMMWT